MSNPDRILERLRRVPPDMTFREVQTLLKSLGWTIRQGGKPSHYMLKRPGGMQLLISTKGGRYVKQEYLRMILKELERGEGE